MTMGGRAGADPDAVRMRASAWRWGLALCVLAIVAVLAWAGPADAQDAAVDPGPPGGTLGQQSDADIWRALRQGSPATINIENPNAGVLIQSEGQRWREVNSEALPTYGAMYIVGMLFLMCLFFALHGRVRLRHGRSGRKIKRFSTLERAAHWMLASSFILLAVTGSTLRYGREALIPLIGHDAFSTLASTGKLIHNCVAFAFMAALVTVFALWIRENIPNRHDVVWVLRGGGLVPGLHAPARKFNAGQKLVFWAVMLFGILLSLSGLALLFPYTTGFTSGIFSIVNYVFSTDLPTVLNPIQEQQYSQLWHSIISVVFIVIIMFHIYIGTIGMEGAFEAMGTGKVDLNWAREHHNLWVEEIERERAAPARPSESPAE